MTWFFQQSTGSLYHDGNYIFKGYAGKDTGKFNPEMQGVSNIGPLPRGKYLIVGSPFHHPHTGNYSIRLKLDLRNNIFGRAEFLIHGDSV